ncbi:family 10 glycosylhydrolase [Bacillus pacificus]
MVADTVAVQIKPTADAFYPLITALGLDITGTQGKDGYDPLAFMIEEAHSKFAWINHTE